LLVIRFTQTSAERLGEVGSVISPKRGKKPNYRHRRLLRTRRERPRGCRAAEQRYELASFHSITLAVSIGATFRPNRQAIISPSDHRNSYFFPLRLF
jgi:hypothetical protein